MKRSQSVYLGQPALAKDPSPHNLADLDPDRTLLAEPRAFLATQESPRLEPVALPSIEPKRATEEWRPQPRKRSQISVQRELSAVSNGANELSVSFPEPNRIIFSGPTYFASWESGITRKFAELSLGIHEVRELEIDTINRRASLLLADNGRKVLRKLIEVYRGERGPDLSVTYSPRLTRVHPGKIPRIRLFRYGKTITTWELRVSVPG